MNSHHVQLTHIAVPVGPASPDPCHDDDSALDRASLEWNRTASLRTFAYGVVAFGAVLATIVAIVGMVLS
jgi:hypothetical protein